MEVHLMIRISADDLRRLFIVVEQVLVLILANSVF